MVPWAHNLRVSTDNRPGAARHRTDQSTLGVIVGEKAGAQ